MELIDSLNFGERKARAGCHSSADKYRRLAIETGQ